VNPIIPYLAKYPNVKLLGPATIDFDWILTFYFMSQCKSNVKFNGLSSHLYVDRRGAPENKQGSYSLVEKCAMMKSFTRNFDTFDDKFVITETNYPVVDTGVYSPIGSPYCAPSWYRDRPGINLKDYANYLVRYYLLAICSSHVDRVYWWRLSAKGYGLLDDQDGFKERPAYTALKYLLHRLSKGYFIKRLVSTSDTYFLLFEVENKKVVVGWSNNDEPMTTDCIINTMKGYNIENITDVLGDSISFDNIDMSVKGCPYYFCICPLSV
jgi:hypothetical protein